MFKFESGTSLKSVEELNITSDVADSDIPLLLSKPSMKKKKKS